MDENKEGNESDRDRDRDRRREITFRFRSMAKDILSKDSNLRKSHHGQGKRK
jgi:hypothetical protein